ncbi:hypothetical protein E2C01_060168 [Portunus trituberculatus]|uniref:Uncharacterized protein n=1 Tax=Portunus trituberculatus TaxID=210409 RepID=A0A5B7H8K1_PORTR|nr:hypothetical protein [Portunus trituberculatus]
MSVRKHSPSGGETKQGDACRKGSGQTEQLSVLWTRSGGDWETALTPSTRKGRTANAMDEGCTPARKWWPNTHVLHQTPNCVKEEK